MSAGLAVLVDGTPMAEPEARAFWQRFSDWMEEHKGDLAGFAAKEGFASVHPGVDAGRPVLFASTKDAQRPYTAVKESGAPGGSPARSPTARSAQRPSRKSHNLPRKGRG